MATKTRTDLTKEAFGILVGLDKDSEPSPEDVATIDTYVDPLVAQLSKDEIIYIDDTNAIAQEYFLPLARLLANVAGPRYGSAMNEDAKRIDEGALRRLTSSGPTYEVQRAVYY